MVVRFSKDKMLKDGTRPKILSPYASLLQEVKEHGGVEETKDFYETRGACQHRIKIPQKRRNKIPHFYSIARGEAG